MSCCPSPGSTCIQKLVHVGTQRPGPLPEGGAAVKGQPSMRAHRGTDGAMAWVASQLHFCPCPICPPLPCSCGPREHHTLTACMQISIAGPTSWKTPAKMETTEHGEGRTACREFALLKGGTRLKVGLGPPTALRPASQALCTSHATTTREKGTWCGCWEEGWQRSARAPGSLWGQVTLDRGLQLPL